jgi:dGTP triphosphohydrolase
MKGVFDSAIERIGYYSPRQFSSAEREKIMLMEIKDGLAKGEFVPYFQPKINIENGMIIGAEVVSVWKHPERGLLEADTYISILEKYGLTALHDRVLWEKVCADMRAWLDRYPKITLPVSVNMTAYDLLSCDVCAFFDELMEKCALDKRYADKIMPSTLEGGVVRISDIIAYLGKDRQDAILVEAVSADDFASSPLGAVNAEIVNNLIVNVIENSYGKPFIKLDETHFQALRQAKSENYEKIYNCATEYTGLSGSVKTMMTEVYGQLLADLKNGVKTSPVFTHHLAQVARLWGAHADEYAKTEENQLVVDYIASMTDDYFIELYEFLFPGTPHGLKYHSYFD